MDTRHLETLLENLDFGDLERAIASFLAKKGPHLAGIISKRLNIKRTTTYSTLEKLESRGFVVRTHRGGKTIFSLAPTSLFIESLRDSEQHAFKRKQEQIRLLEKEMISFSSIQPPEESHGQVITVGEDKVYTVQLAALMSGNFDAIFDPSVVAGSRRGKSVMEKFLRETANTKSHIRELVPQSKWADWYIKRIKNKNHKVRFLPLDQRIETDVIITSKLVFMLHYAEPEYAVQITHAQAAESLRTWFSYIWELGKPIG